MPIVHIQITQDGATRAQKAELILRTTRTLAHVLGKNPGDDLTAFLSHDFDRAALLAIAQKTISHYADRLAATPLDAGFQARAWNAPQGVAV